MSESENSQERPVIAVTGREDMRLAIIDLIEQAQSEILILSNCLESALYRAPELVEALKQRLLDQRRLHVRLIISDPPKANREAGNLIELSRRLSSRFEFREPINRDWQFEKETVVVDRKAWFQRLTPLSATAKLGRLDAPGAALCIKEFDEHWLNSQPATEFRRLGI